MAEFTEIYKDYIENYIENYRKNNRDYDARILNAYEKYKQNTKNIDVLNTLNKDDDLTKMQSTNMQYWTTENIPCYITLTLYSDKSMDNIQWLNNIINNDIEYIQFSFDKIIKYTTNSCQIKIHTNYLSLKQLEQKNFKQNITQQLETIYAYQNIKIKKIKIHTPSHNNIISKIYQIFCNVRQIKIKS